jgi:hypothetical protein
MTGVNQAPPYKKDFVDDRDVGGSRSANKGWEVNQDKGGQYGGVIIRAFRQENSHRLLRYYAEGW